MKKYVNNVIKTFGKSELFSYYKGDMNKFVYTRMYERAHFL